MQNRSNHTKQTAKFRTTSPPIKEKCVYVNTCTFNFLGYVLNVSLKAAFNLCAKTGDSVKVKVEQQMKPRSYCVICRVALAT